MKVYANIGLKNEIITMRSENYLYDGGNWVEVDEGEGFIFEHPECGYIEGGFTESEYGIPKYKLIDGRIENRSTEEIIADIPKPSIDVPTLEERISDLEAAICELMDSN